MKRNTKKERIISAAIKLWGETHSVQKVSLADIAREAGVSQTTIYNNFGTRDGLVKEVIKRLMRESMDKQWEIIKSDLPVSQKIQSIFAVKASAVQTFQNAVLSKLTVDTLGHLYLNEIYESDVKPMTNTLIEECKQQGYIRPDLPNEAIMIYLDMVIEGMMADTERLHRLTADTRLLSALTRLIYYGLLQKELDFTIDFKTEKEKE